MQVKANVYVKMIIAMVIYGTIGVFRRYTSYPSGFLAMTRGIIGAAFVFVYMILSRKERIKIDKKRLIIIVISGALIGLNWMFLFEAYNHTTVAVATMCYYMAPTIIIVLATLLLKEKISVLKCVSIVLAMLGMLLVSGVIESGGFALQDMRGIALGLAAAAIYAVVVILNKIARVEDIYTKTVIQLLAAGVIIIPYVFVTGQMNQLQLDTVSIANTLILGIVHTGIAYVFYFGAMQTLPAQTTAILSFIDPVTAVLISALFLQESMTVFAIVGTILILASAVIQELFGKK